MTDAATTTPPLPLDTHFAAAQLEAWLPPVSPLARVDCASTAKSMTVAEAIAMAITLIPKGPDLDLVALSTPARLHAAVSHHAALAVLSAALEHHRNTG